MNPSLPPAPRQIPSRVPTPSPERDRARRRAQLLLALGMGATVALWSAPVQAHVSVNPTGTAAGSSTVAGFSFSHGCAENPTTALSVELPAGLESVTPVVHPGWSVEVHREGQGHDAPVRAVTWTARQPVADGLRDTVSLAFTVPDTAGQTLHFPTVQTCTEGETAWIEQAPEGTDPHDLEAPAPTFVVTEAQSTEEHSTEDHSTGAAAGHEHPAGSPEQATAEEEPGHESSGAIAGWALGTAVLALLVALGGVLRRRA